MVVRGICPWARMSIKQRAIWMLMLVVGALVLVFAWDISEQVTFEVHWQNHASKNVQSNQNRKTQWSSSSSNAITHPKLKHTRGVLPNKTTTVVFRRRPATTANIFIGPLVLHSNDLDKAGIPGMQRDKEDGAWYRMSSSVELYVYSAHYDNRKSLLSKPVVRVIGVSELTERDQFFCVVWFRNKSKIVRINAYLNEIGGGVWMNDRLFTEFLLSCPMFDESMPTHVSVVLSLKEKPTFAVPIEIPEIAKKRHEIGICVSLTYWHHDPSRIVEWIEFQRLMGVGGITIYNNTMSEESQRIFSYYAKTEPDFLLLRQSFVFIQDNDELTFHMQMSPVINDCIYRYRLRYKSILVIDLDEFVVPYSTDDLPTMLSSIKEQYFLSSDRSLTHQFTFRNTYFFLNFPPMPNQPSEMVVLRNMRRVHHSEMGYSAKSLVGVNSCIAMHNHYCWHHTAAVDRHDMFNIIEVKPKIAFLHHYKRCHLSYVECQELFQEETLDTRLLQFETVLKQRVSDKRADLGMSPLS